MLQKLSLSQSFVLESNQTIENLEIAYHTFGKLNDAKDNVVWICHALTANSDPTDWWQGLVGEGSLIDPQKYFIVCANIIGSCYGTTQPLSINAISGKPYFLDFPFITIKDMVNAHILLANHLQLNSIKLLMGGSLGGQQAMEWAIKQPERFENLFLIATNAFHSPWGIAFNESQRLAIEADPTFNTPSTDGGKNGLKAARSIALLSYRNYNTYNHSQSEDDLNKTENFKAASYQEYQGEKLVKRFNAYSYYYLSKAMDSHNVGRGNLSIEDALSKIEANTQVVSISSDLLFPPIEQSFLSKHIPHSQYYVIDSLFGHDGFLLETEKITEILEKLI